MDFKHKVLNRLVADLASLNTKTASYEEALGHQNCLDNTLWDSNHALCDQLAHACVKIGELLFSMTRRIVVECTETLQCQKNPRVHQCTQEPKILPSQQRKGASGWTEPHVLNLPNIIVLLLHQVILDFGGNKIQQNQSVVVEFTRAHQALHSGIKILSLF